MVEEWWRNGREWWNGGMVEWWNGLSFLENLAQINS
jgi:hypothetical protein